MQLCQLWKVYYKDIMEQYLRMGKQEQEKHTQWKAAKHNKVKEV